VTVESYLEFIEVFLLFTLQLDARVFKETANHRAKCEIDCLH